MTPMAVVFMVGSWTFVLGLTLWAFSRVLRAQKERPEPRGD